MSDDTEDGGRDDFPGGHDRPSADDAGGSAATPFKPVDLADWGGLDLADRPLEHLLTALASCDPGTASVAEHLSASWACEHLIRALGARQTQHLALAGDLIDQEKEPGRRSADGYEEVAGEISPRFALSKYQALHRAGQAQHLNADLPGILGLVRDRRIELRSAALVDRVMRQVLSPSSPHWRAVAAQIEKIAPGLSLTELEHAVRLAIELIDPIAAQERHDRARKQRKVEVFPLEDGMGAINATVTADDAMLTDEVLDGLADACRNHCAAAGAPDRRTHQQRRADALVRAIAHGTALPLLPVPPDPYANSTDKGWADENGADGNGLGGGNGADGNGLGDGNRGDRWVGTGGPDDANRWSDETSVVDDQSTRTTENATEPSAQCPPVASEKPSKAMNLTNGQSEDPREGHHHEPPGQHGGDQPSSTAHRSDHHPSDHAPGDLWPGGLRPGDEPVLDGLEGLHHDLDHAMFGGTYLPPSIAPSALGGTAQDRIPSWLGVLAWWLPPVLPTRHGRRPHLVITIAASTLNGDDEMPGLLSGYGPVPANLARKVAADAGRTSIIRIPTGDHPCEAAATKNPSTQADPHIP